STSCAETVETAVSAAGSALFPRLVLRPGSAQLARLCAGVSRDMPVRLGLCASRANELLIGFPIQRFNVSTNHPDDALACAYSSCNTFNGSHRGAYAWRLIHNLAHFFQILASIVDDS